MTLNLSILGWSASNLRCPDHEISLCPPNSQNPYKVTFIQMPNGTGKTTTLELLRATLSGSAKGWTSEQILEFRNNNNLAESGSFIIKLLLNDRLLTFELKLNFSRKQVKYRTTYGSGINDGFSPPPNIRKFLSPQFVSLFIFNGELARNLLDSKQTRARDAIDVLFQLSLLEDVAKKFQDNWEAHAAKASSTSDVGLQRRKNRLEKLKTRSKEIKAKKEELHLQKSSLNTEFQKAEREYNLAFNKDNDLGQKFKERHTDLTYAEKTVSLELQQTIEEMRNPQKLFCDFSLYLLNLKDNLDSLKLPTSTSQEFFEELAKAEECVCGRPMDDKASKKVRERANQYLAEDEVGILNSIKSDIANYCHGEEIQGFSQEMNEKLEQLGHSIRLRDNIKTEISAIEKQRLEQGDSELENKKQEVDNLKHKLEACEKKLKEIERQPLSNANDDTECLKELNNLIKQVEEDVAEATNTILLKKKTEIVREILTKARQQAREKLRKFIIEGTNQRISQLLSRNPVVLEDIQDSLKLENRQGASEGQTLSVSYAFLATLFNQSTYQLPFIVDSPVISLDLNVRTEVARLIPFLSEQFLAFTISSERQGFINTLHPITSDNIKYLTLFRKTSEMKDIYQNLHIDIVTETIDGVLIEGKEFFEQFDLDNEV